MNKINIQQTGGFPLETDTLKAMQDAYEIFNSLGNIVAPLAILIGCENTGNTVANGVVNIHGEVLEFKGGHIGKTVIIKEETDNRTFENGDNKIVYRKRFATFGNSVQTDNHNWDDFHRSKSIKEIEKHVIEMERHIGEREKHIREMEKRLVHVGFIQDYYGNIHHLPAGWALCDGNNGTPDLRGLFVVGFDNRNWEYNEIGKRGGLKDVTLNEAQMPSHTHGGETTDNGSHTHSYSFVGADNGSGRCGLELGKRGGWFKDGTSWSGEHKHWFKTNPTGGNQPHENRPPFYVLAKIMYIG